MRTDNDVRLALRERADELGPYSDGITSRTHVEPAGSRTVWLPALAAAVLVLVVALTSIVLPAKHKATHHSPNRSVAGPSTGNAPAQFDPRYTYFDPAPTDGITATTIDSGSTQQRLRVYRDGQYTAQVTLRSATGAALPDETARSNVEVNGRPGVLTQGSGFLRLSWMYAANAWATLESGSSALTSGVMTSDQAFAIADAVRLVPARQIVVPMQLRSLPPGQALQSLRSCTSSCAGSPGAIAFFGPSASDGNVLSVDVEGPQLRSTISDTPPQGAAAAHAAGLAGWWSDDNTLVLLGPDYVVRFSVRPDMHTNMTTLTHDDVLAVANSMTMASQVADPATWLSAASAIP